jgi:hypothetical protein
MRQKPSQSSQEARESPLARSGQRTEEERAAASDRTRRVWEERRRGLRPVPRTTKELKVSRPCLCGCGAQTSPGRKFRQGHHWRRRDRRDLNIEEMSGGKRDEETEQLEPVVSRCARCRWSSELLPPTEAAAAFRSHVYAAAA